jgi:hypothetical protein
MATQDPFEHDLLLDDDAGALKSVATTAICCWMR